MEVRSAGNAGNGCFAAAAAGVGKGKRHRNEREEVIKAGTTVLEAKAMVLAVNDEHESRNCRFDYIVHRYY